MCQIKRQMTNSGNIKYTQCTREINFLTLQRALQSTNIYNPIEKSEKIQLGN